MADMARPQVSEEVKERVESLTQGDFNVPAHRVTFDDRLRLVLNRYEEKLNAENSTDVSLPDNLGTSFDR
jgi:hypothetical protein